MSIPTIFFVSFVIALSGALAPGPLLATVIYESARRGFHSAPLMMLGHAVLEAVMVAVLVFGFARIINNPLLLKIISLSGALILCYFGMRMLLTLPKASLELKSVTHRHATSLPLLGLTMSLANPYWTIWWMTTGLGMLLVAQKAGITGIAAFFLGHILADTCWYCVVSFAISRGKHLLSRKTYQWIIFFCAATLLSFGVWFGIGVLR